MPATSIRRLVPSDAAAYQALRLMALRDAPTAFSATLASESDTPLATIAQHMAPDSGRNRFGAFAGAALVGVVGVGRETSPKLCHKGFIGGMFVAPSHRGSGLGRQLLVQALDFAAAMPGLRQVQLSVTAGNGPALALYQALGFTVYGHEPDAMLVGGVYYDTLHMQRMLGELR